MNGQPPDNPDASRPLVDQHVDLRDYPYTPIFRTRLFASRFNNLASDAEWRAGVTLWLRSWDQVPAGSLPHDDRELCALAGLGRDLRAWNKVKRWALYLWEPAADGRLYHRVVAETVNHAWELKLANRHRTAAARAARSHKSGDKLSRNPVTKPATSSKERRSKGRIGESETAEIGCDPPRANGHDREVENSMNSVPVGRSAPLAPSAPSLRQKRKDLLEQKLMRFVNATLRDADRHAAHVGLMGDDPQHSRQWWFDQLDRQMRAQRWDDAQ